MNYLQNIIITILLIIGQIVLLPVVIYNLFKERIKYWRLFRYSVPATIQKIINSYKRLWK